MPTEKVLRREHIERVASYTKSKLDGAIVVLVRARTSPSLLPCTVRHGGECEVCSLAQQECAWSCSTLKQYLCIHLQGKGRMVSWDEAVRLTSRVN